MRSLSAILLFCSITNFCFAISLHSEDSSATSFEINVNAISDSNLTNTSNFYNRCIAWPDSFRKDRFRGVVGSSAAIWGGSLIFLNSIWYKNYPKSSFHLFNDNAEWLQMDKVGHVYSCYLGTKAFTTFFRWSGVKPSRSRTYGMIGGMAYQSVIEILDGYSYKWGFSLGDMGANLAGSCLYSVQDRLWNEQRILMKISAHTKDYKTIELLRRANNLYGSSVSERLFKDYNAQTYWLSASPGSFAKNSAWPKWLNIAIGYGADNMYGGFENIARDDFGNIEYLPNGQKVFDRTDLPRYRQFYLAPDIDWSKIPWRSKFLKDFFKLVNLKLPTPSLEYNSLNKLKINAVHF